MKIKIKLDKVYQKKENREIRIFKKSQKQDLSK